MDGWEEGEEGERRLDVKAAAHSGTLVRSSALFVPCLCVGFKSCDLLPIRNQEG